MILTVRWRRMMKIVHHPNHFNNKCAGALFPPALASDVFLEIAMDDPFSILPKGDLFKPKFKTGFQCPPNRPGSLSHAPRRANHGRMVRIGLSQLLGLPSEFWGL